MNYQDLEVSKLQPQYVASIIDSFSKLAKPYFDVFLLSIVNKLKEKDSDIMQSGEDSNCQNLWEEYCFQVQEEHGFGFEMVEDYIKNLILSACITLQKEEPHIFQAVYLYMDAILYNLITSPYIRTEGIECTDPQDLADSFFDHINKIAMEYPLPE